MRFDREQRKAQGIFAIFEKMLAFSEYAGYTIKYVLELTSRFGWSQLPMDMDQPCRAIGFRGSRKHRHLGDETYVESSFEKAVILSILEGDRGGIEDADRAA